MLRGSREDMLDGRPRPCEKRYIAGYEPEYECRLKFRENSRHTNSSITPTPPQTPSQDTSILQTSSCPTTRTQIPFHRASTKNHIPLPFTGTSGPSGHPFPAVFQPDERSPARRACHSQACSGSHARVHVKFFNREDSKTLEGRRPSSRAIDCEEDHSAASRNPSSLSRSGELDVFFESGVTWKGFPRSA